MSSLNNFANIFPRQTINPSVVIVDELCECGHFRTAHNGGVLNPGHGACFLERCNCVKFRWSANVTREKGSKRAEIE